MFFKLIARYNTTEALLEFKVVLHQNIINLFLGRPNKKLLGASYL